MIYITATDGRLYQLTRAQAGATAADFVLEAALDSRRGFPPQIRTVETHAYTGGVVERSVTHVLVHEIVSVSER